MNNLTPIKRCENLVMSLEDSFTKLSSDIESSLVFNQEAQFAIQALQGNDFLTKIALNNQASLRNAVLNIASIGLSLNPVKKHAYLIPRKGVVCLDISYMGLVDIALRSGMIKFIQAKMVCKGDEFEYRGVSQEPLHKFNPFDKREDVIGVYCIAKTSDGDFLTEMMNVEEINDIRNRSESFKRNSGPWVKDYDQMAKKTVIKRAVKLLPKSDISLDAAIETLNQHEGIDFEQERKEAENEGKRAREAQIKAAQEEQEKKFEAIDEIVSLSSTITKDYTQEEKIKFKDNVIGVTNFKEGIKRKSIEELNQIIDNLKDMI